MNTIITKLRLVGLILAIHLFHLNESLGNTITWTGIHNNEWNQVENWQPMIVPDLNDDVIIPAWYTNEIEINNANASCKTLFYNGEGFTLKIMPGWDLILSEQLNIAGSTTIEGLGGIEIVGQNQCDLIYSNDVIFDIKHINIKNDAMAILHNDLFLPDGNINLFTGGFSTNGKTITVNKLLMINGGISRKLLINNSTINAQVISLGLDFNGEFYSDNSIVNINKMIMADASCSFHIINAMNGVTMITSGFGTDMVIDELNAEKDINVLGNQNHTNQHYYIKEFNLLNAPAIIRLTPQPYVQGYYFKKIVSTSGCHGELYFSDANEISYNQIYIESVEPALFQKASFANIRVGSSNFTSYSGRNLGNNSGISFLQSNPVSLYWIGGAGSWYDVNHWSYSSGGSSAGCIPGLNDHAIFDNNSGFNTNDSVKFDNHTFCRDIIIDSLISQKPIFAQSSGRIFQFMISGNINLYALQENQLEYPIVLCSPENVYMNVGSNILLNDVYLINKGMVQLRSNLNCRYGTKSIFQLLGGFSTNNHELNIAGIYSAGYKLLPSNRSLNLGSSKIFVGHIDNTGGAVYTYADSLDLNAGTSEFIFVHQLNMSHQIQIDGLKNLDFYNVSFLNKTIYPYIRFNERSGFNKIHFYGNGKLVNGSTNINSNMAGTDTLVITGGFRYELESSRMIRINKQVIQIHGVCNELSLLTSDNLVNVAYLYCNSSQPITIPNTWVENLHAISPLQPVEVVGGVNGGNSLNFSFITPNIPRVFYWNGESTTFNWLDGGNWNLNQPPTFGPQNDIFLYNINGCLPGFNDSVVFTPNSFPVNDTVFINGYVSFNGICWTPGSGSNRYLNGNSQFEFNNYGGSRFDENLSILFAGNYMLRSPFNRELKFNHVTYPGNIVFYGLGTYNLLDEMSCSGYAIEFRAGSFNSNGKSIKANNFFIKHDSAPVNNSNSLNFNFSNIEVNGNVVASLYNNRSELFATSAAFHMPSPNGFFNLYGDMPGFDVGVIRYTSTNGAGGFNSSLYNSPIIPHIRLMEFNPSGSITGNNSIDSIYLAEGKEYSFGSNQTQQINNILYSKGSPCYRTTINSTIPGVRAFIKNPSCNLIIEHARVKDIEGIIGTCATNNYYVGVGGEDLGNNMNWFFVPGNPINGLGEDTILSCASIPYHQLTTGFGRYESIVWMDESTQRSYTVSGPDTISVTITYSPVCIIQDSRYFQFESQMSQNAEITNISCFGKKDGIINLEVLDADSGFSQQWIYENVVIASNEYVLNNASPGTYTSIISLPGWEEICSDTAEFSLHEPVKLTITIDSVIPGKCNTPEGIILTSSAGGTGSHSYIWNDNSHNGDRYDAIQGNHTVVVKDENGCLDSASTMLVCIDGVLVPQLITPNGDGLGDEWEIIDLLRLYPTNTVSLFNRWGGKVYYKEGYNNDFTGISNTGDCLGKGYLPSGTYFYLIELGENIKPLTGYLELIY